jgi:hypothetical protein
MNLRAGRTRPVRRRQPYPWWSRELMTMLCRLPFGSSLSARLACLTLRHLRTFTCVGRTRSSLVPLRLRAGRFRLASRLGVPDNPAVTLSPELHTEPLPAPHVRVGTADGTAGFI